MAVKGSAKELSVRHERHLAKLFSGRRSASSGGADNDAGDVRAKHVLIECKMTGGPGKKNPRPKLVKDLEKVCEEAWAEGRDPVLALRYYNPDSILADREGWIDLTVRRASDDAERELYYAEVSQQA